MVSFNPTPVRAPHPPRFGMTPEENALLVKVAHPAAHTIDHQPIEVILTKPLHRDMPTGELLFNKGAVLTLLGEDAYQSPVPRRDDFAPHVFAFESKQDPCPSVPWQPRWAVVQRGTHNYASMDNVTLANAANLHKTSLTDLQQTDAHFTKQRVYQFPDAIPLHRRFETEA